MSTNESGPAYPLPVLCDGCGRALANVGEWCCDRFTTSADVVTAAAETVPIDVAVGRALKAAIAEHMMFTETSGGVYEMGYGTFGAYHWCACGWRSDDGPWRDPAQYVSGMAQAKIDHLANATYSAIREHVELAKAALAETRTTELRRIVADEIEAKLQDASSNVAEVMAEVWQKEYGWTDTEIRDALSIEDINMMQRYRTIGFASAWDDYEHEEKS